MVAIPVPQQPLRIALIGAGQRAWNIYRPLFSSLTPWVEVVAVCDPAREHAEAMATALRVPMLSDVRALVAARPMEAALVVTPVDSHFAISVFLSSYRIHTLVETVWCNMVAQARQMIATARQHGVVVRVAENFFRSPTDRMVQAIAASGALGKIGRVVSYADHTGYHNNSRSIVLAKAHPIWVQAFEHTIPTASFHSTPERFHNTETYRVRFYMFPGNLLVVDHAANIKGFLGRHVRPGYTEWQGERGTIVLRGVRPWEGAAEVHYVTDEGLRHVDRDVDHTHPTEVCPIVEEYDGKMWLRSYVDLPSGRIEYTNPFRPVQPAEHANPWHGSPVMNHIIDFTLAVRGLQKSEFDENDALMSLMLEVGASESARNGGQRVPLPLRDDIGSDQAIREGLRKKYGVDPLDVEAMLAISHPKI